MLAVEPDLTGDVESVVARTVATANPIHDPMPPLPDAEHWNDKSRVVCHMNLSIHPDGTIQRALASGCTDIFRDRATDTVKTWTFAPILDEYQQAVRSTYAFDLTYRRADRPVRSTASEGPSHPQLPEPPRLLRWAMNLEISCSAVLRINAEGTVEEVDVEGCTEEVIRSIQAAAHQWEFEPTQDDAGVSIPTLYPVTVTFRSTDLIQESLSVNIPGLMSIPLAAAYKGDIPPPPPGVMQLDEPLPKKSTSSQRIKAAPDSIFHWIAEMGEESAQFQHYLLVTVNKRGRVTEVDYLDGPPELQAYATLLVRAIAFDRSGIEHSDPVRFVMPFPIRFKPK
ncbi:MAG TPA: hypothetical protein DFR83_16875 [Deltaproteobacteria bacterium]|nr:hypothetical protein [Deltaproteobacteria bacterium]